jgi:hypothetical protein
LENQHADFVGCWRPTAGSGRLALLFPA